MIDLQQQLLEHLKPSGDREREAFVDWTRSVILDLDHALWRRCQHEVSATLYRYIAENDALKRQPDPEPSTSTSQQMAPQTPHMWQSHPSQWPSHLPVPKVGVWQSTDANWQLQQCGGGQQYTITQLQSAGPPFAASTPSGPSPILQADFSFSQFLNETDSSARQTT